MLVVTLLDSWFDRRGSRLRALTVLWARTMLCICRIEVRFKCLAQLDPSGQYVFVSNHGSWIDIPILIANLPFDLAFIAKQELFKMPLVGACLRRTGQIPVDRANAQVLAGCMKKANDAITRQGRSLLLFAAGTRASTGVGNFKDGAAYLAIRSGLPVVPVGMMGTARVMSRGSIRVRGASLSLTVGWPVPTENLRVADRGELTRQLQDQVTSLTRENSR